MIEIGVNPVVFGNVRWYGVLVALAIAALVLWVTWHVKNDKHQRVSVDTVLIAAIVGIPSGVIVSRLIHVIDLWDYYFRNPGEIIGGEGLTIWGAIIGATLGIWVTSKITKFNFNYLSDILAPGLIIAQVIGRIGCIINGCCYGEACSLPWAIIYTHPETFGPMTVAVHPTQVYEIIFLAVSFGIIMFLRGRIKPEGSLFMIYMGLYSIWRISLGFMREGTDFALGLHQAQIIGIITLLIVIPLLVTNTRWGNPDEPVMIYDNSQDEVSPESPATAEERDDADNNVA